MSIIRDLMVTLKLKEQTSNVPLTKITYLEVIENSTIM